MRSLILMKMRFGFLLVACAMLSWTGSLDEIARAALTDEIQVYDAEINEVGQFSVEWHNNFTAIGHHEPDFPGGIAPNHTLNGVPEWAYGVTEWFEAGPYLPVYSLTGEGHLLFDSAKLRALLVTPHADEKNFLNDLAPLDQQDQTGFIVVDYKGEVNSVEFGMGHSFTGGGEDLVFKLVLSHNFNAGQK